MANTLITTIEHGVSAALAFLSDSANNAKHQYYVFVGESFGNSNSAPDPIDSSYAGIMQAYNQMQFGKVVGSNSMSVVIRNIPYVTGIVYDMYDDRDQSLLTDKNFYVSTVSGSYYHVFKCLDNNLGANSTTQPNFSDIVGSNTVLYQTADGYRWKYMYTFDLTANAMFASSNYIPVVPNTSVTAMAVRGAIDIIVIDNVGRGYDNYVTGTFTAADLRINGDSTVYQIANATAKTVNGFYTGCGMYISSGTGAGQYKKVVDYISNANGNYVYVDSFFSINPTNGTQFEIYPDINVIGNGTQTTNVVARGLVNASASNSIYRIEVINRGADYRYATATATANSVVSVIRPANLHPIIPPYFGHGSDPYFELGANRVAFYAQFANTEANTIPSTNQFRQVGIIRDPQFLSVVTSLQFRQGTFLPGEAVSKIDPILVDSNVTINGSNVSCNTANFLNQFKANDSIYLFANGLAQCITTVNTVTNLTFLTLASNSVFNSTNAQVYTVNPKQVGVISAFDGSSNVTITQAQASFFSNAQLIGMSSSATGYVLTTYRQGIAKTAWTTFVNMFKYVGAITFGEFVPNEYVYQSDITQANAILYSATVDSGTMTMYTSNQTGVFTTGTSIIGHTSGALASVTTKYLPELIAGSGKIVYMENRAPVLRQNNQTEQIKLVIDF